MTRVRARDVARVRVRTMTIVRARPMAKVKVRLRPGQWQRTGARAINIARVRAVARWLGRAMAVRDGQ